MTTARELAAEHQEQCLQHIGEMPYWTVLLTGSFDVVQTWGFEIVPWPRWLDARKGTFRIQVFAEPDDPLAAIERAATAAEKWDVTLQLLCVLGRVEESAVTSQIGRVTATAYECREEYPVVHLASSGEKWGQP